MSPWLFLAIAVVCEVVGTSALRSTDGFTRPWPSAIVVAGYASAFYFLSLTLKTVPVGVVYAVWSGVGTVLITVIGWAFMGQRLDLPAVVGIVLVVTGVVVMNGLSKAVAY